MESHFRQGFLPIRPITRVAFSDSLNSQFSLLWSLHNTPVRPHEKDTIVATGKCAC